MFVGVEGEMTVCSVGHSFEWIMWPSSLHLCMHAYVIEVEVQRIAHFIELDHFCGM